MQMLNGRQARAALAFLNSCPPFLLLQEAWEEMVDVDGGTVQILHLQLCKMQVL